MTMFAIHLVRLRGDERWEEYGDDWRDRVERVAELHGRTGWELHSRLGDRKALQLDFATYLWPMTKAELLDLYAGPSIEASLRPGDGRQLHMLKALPEDGRFGRVVVEVY